MMVNSRIKQLSSWVQNKYPEASELVGITNDASNRKYFKFDHNNKNYLAVDSPRELEKNSEFVFYQDIFKNLNILVPDIYHYDESSGFFVINHFGDNIFLNVLNKNTVDNLYSKALEPLYKLANYNGEYLEKYSEEKLKQEMALCHEWLITKYFKLDNINPEIFNDAYEILTNNILNQPQVLIHKDYHCRNMLLTSDDQVAVIDFQDAMQGPITYDIVSLLRDCYIDWPEQKVYDFLKIYFDNLYKDRHHEDRHHEDRHHEDRHSREGGNPDQISFQQFTKYFDYMTLQRHLKTSGQFARFYLKNNDDRYLQYLPRVLGYLKYVTGKYPEFNKLHKTFIICEQLF